MLSCSVFQTAVEGLQQERPNPQSVMKSRRRKRVKQRCILAAVREEGAGLGGVIKAGGRRGGDKKKES